MPAYKKVERKKKHAKGSKKWIIYTISLLFVFCFRFIPPISGMSASGMQVLGIFIGTLILWLTTAIDWPSILCLAGLAFVPEQKMNGILASSFGNSTFAYGTAVAVVTVIVALVVGYPIASSVFPVV